MKKNISLFFYSLVFVTLFGCKGGGEKANDVITIKGSDTMVQLGQRWSEKFMADHKDVGLQVTGGGSGTGISALINGTTDICMASRPMKDAEKQQMLIKSKVPENAPRKPAIGSA